MMHKINLFYKKYDIANWQHHKRVTKSDMYNHDTLMGVYEDIYDNFAYYEDEDEVTLKFLFNLYGELGDYLTDMPSPYKWQSQTMGNIVSTFGEVVRQAWDSLIHYHTLDLKWSYNKRGF